MNKIWADDNKNYDDGADFRSRQGFTLKLEQLFERWKIATRNIPVKPAANEERDRKKKKWAVLWKEVQ